jgi:hypothetical protein
VRVREGGARVVRTFRAGFFMIFFDEWALLLGLRFPNDSRSVTILAWAEADLYGSSEVTDGRHNIGRSHVWGPAARHEGEGVLRRPDCLSEKNI